MSNPSFGSVFADFGTAISHQSVKDPVLKIPIEINGAKRDHFAMARIVGKYVYLWNSEVDFKGNKEADYVCIAYEIHQLRLEDPSPIKYDYKGLFTYEEEQPLREGQVYLRCEIRGVPYGRIYVDWSTMMLVCYTGGTVERKPIQYKVGENI